MKQNKKTDQELVQEALLGNQSAYTNLLNRHKGPLNFTLLKMVHSPEDSEDLTMVAFTKAFERLHEYNPEYNFSTWLFNIGINGTIDFIRGLKRRETLIKNTFSMDARAKTEEGEPISVGIKSKLLTPEEIILQEEKYSNLRRAVKNLRPTYKNLLELYYFEEMSYKEIAHELNKPSGSVKAQLYRAKEELRFLLDTNKEFKL